jgi:branched-chain amino acid transport system permease protein
VNRLVSIVRQPLVLGLLLLLVLALLPLSALDVPGLLPGSFASAGTLQLLAISLIFAALALSYDVLIGFTGLLSFGHALSFSFGVYATAILITKAHWGLLPAGLAALAIGIVAAIVTGSVSLRVSGIAFAMVTLALAQAGSVFVIQDPLGITGGVEGISLDADRIPDVFIGVVNTRNLYWLALALAAVVYVIVRGVTNSSAGHVWAAIRENEARVAVLGLRPYLFKLIAFVVGSSLATLCGVVYVVVLGGATDGVTTAAFTLSLLVMVILGGSGVRWGAMLGGFIYTLLDQRLGNLAGSDQVAGLPEALRIPLSQPQFILGVIFILVVLFLPGGFASLLRSSRSRGQEQDGDSGERAAGQQEPAAAESSSSTPDVTTDQKG